MRHPADGDSPFVELTRTSKGQSLSLPIQGLDFRLTADQDAVLVTTYMPEAAFNVTYYKSVPLIPGATIRQAFQRASSVPFSLIIDDELADMRKASACRLRTLAITCGCFRSPCF